MNELTIGQFLSSLRKSKGYAQQNVADTLNVSNKTVSVTCAAGAVSLLVYLPVAATSTKKAKRAETA